MVHRWSCCQPGCACLQQWSTSTPSHPRVAGIAPGPICTEYLAKKDRLRIKKHSFVTTLAKKRRISKWVFDKHAEGAHIEEEGMTYGDGEFWVESQWVVHRSYHPERKIANIIMCFFVIQLQEPLSQNEFFQVCVHITGPCFVPYQLFFIYHLKALFILFHLNGQNLQKKSMGEIWALECC